MCGQLFILSMWYIWLFSTSTDFNPWLQKVQELFLSSSLSNTQFFKYTQLGHVQHIVWSFVIQHACVKVQKHWINSCWWNSKVCKLAKVILIGVCWVFEQGNASADVYYYSKSRYWLYWSYSGLSRKWRKAWKVWWILEGFSRQRTYPIVMPLFV